MSLGPGEILTVMVVALIVLGPDKLPQAARNIAKFYKEIRNFSNSVRSQMEEVLEIDSGSISQLSSGNLENPDTSGFTLVDNGTPVTKPEMAKGAPLFRPDPEAPNVRQIEESKVGE